MAEIFPYPLYVELEEDDVSILDHVLLSFKPHLSVFPYLGFAAIGNKVIVVIDLGLYEAFLEV